MSRQITERPDGTALRREQWARELPEVDTKGMAIIGRMRWLTLSFRPRIEAVFSDFGLDAGEFDVLATLRRSGSPYRLRPTEIYRWLMISSGGLTARLEKLRRAGYIERTPDPEDARSMLVQLTSKGKTLIERAFRADMATEKEILSSFDGEDMAKLEEILCRMVAAVEEGENTGPSMD